jgi:hypothetical protein
MEVIASHVVHLYYNVIYDEARHRSGDSGTTVTDEYRNSCATFLRIFDKTIPYRKYVSDLHNHFRKVTSGTTISFSECVDKIIKAFMPEEYFRHLKNKQKDAILKGILESSIKQFNGKLFSSNSLTTIIDKRGESASVRALQDIMVEILVTEREKITAKLFDAQNGGAVSSDSHALRALLIKATQLNRKLLAERDAALGNRESILEEGKSAAEERLRGEIADLQRQLAGARDKIRELEITSRHMEAELKRLHELELARVAAPIKTRRAPRVAPEPVYQPQPQSQPVYQPSKAVTFEESSDYFDGVIDIS